MISSYILTVEQMTRADRLTIEAGTPGIELMEAAGLACAEHIKSTYSPRETLVLCGPGNNGGDGFIIARQLETSGWPVRVALIGSMDTLSGDAATAAGRWHATTNAKSAMSIEDVELGAARLVVDALFGTGLSRPIEGPVADLIDRLNDSSVTVVSIDIASGIHGDQGNDFGVALEADQTITFCAPKPGHYLMPGKMYCGKLSVVDIGISQETIEAVAPDANERIFENLPEIWESAFPWSDPMGHKYDRGHVLVVGGPANSTGASRLAAMGALRVGSGLVTIASPPGALAENAAQLTSIMLKPCEDTAALDRILKDERLNSIVIGPGCGVGSKTVKNVKTALRRKRATVLDADALTSFEGSSGDLFSWIQAPTVLTPHWGEFCRLFGEDLDENQNRIERVRTAARKSNAVVVLKGPDTLIARPDGHIAITTNAPPWLATAGSGDVLAGLIAGLQAQGMPAFEAACAGVWIHGEAANEFGPGLISEDLPGQITPVLSELLLQDWTEAGRSE